MGCEYNQIKLNGKLTPKEVKEKVMEYIEECAYESGHGGYTGTMAEATGVRVITDKVFKTEDEAENYLTGIWVPEPDNPNQGEYTDGVVRKWGPAICVKVEGEKNLWIVGADCSS